MWENRREQAAMARSTARRPSTTLDDRELAKLAIAGDGDAFAMLYDRHERRVYGFCLRMLGTPDEAGDATQETFMRLLRRLPALEGRDVNFVAYALTTARNACYDAIGARRRVEPVAEEIEPPGTEPGEVGLDPERAALLAASREDVRAANGRLPERQREVLALRELEQLSYEQIGEIVHLNDNAVAQLISRARIRLREEIRGDALESIAAVSPDCERALPLMACSQDAQRAGADEMDWLWAHMAGCETCRSRRAAMEEAGVSYRALGPIVPLAWLRHTTIARAARFVGADWNHLAGSAPGTHGAAPSSSPTLGTQAATGTHIVAGTHSAADTQVTAVGHAGLSGWMQAASRRLRLASVGKRTGDRRDRRVLGTAALCAILVVVLLIVLLAGSVTPDNRALPQPATRALSSTTTPHAGGRSHGHATRLAHRTSAPVSASLVGNNGTALPSLAPGRGGQPSNPTLAVHHTHRVIHHRSTHRSNPSPTTPTSGTPPPQQPTTTPTSTTPSPSPSSGGSGESTGSGSGTSTGGGETPAAPAGTPTTPGGPPETGHGCALAIAC